MVHLGILFLLLNYQCSLVVTSPSTKAIQMSYSIQYLFVKQFDKIETDAYQNTYIKM